MEQKYMYVLDREKYAKNQLLIKMPYQIILIFSQNAVNIMKNLVFVGLISFFENNSATNK